jgi:uncharacterized protein YfiM (DUF2279 family)
MMRLFIVLSALFLLVSSLGAATDSWLGRDKFMHLVGSAALTAWCDNFARDTDSSKRLVFSISIPLTLGFAKEASDKYVRKTMWSWRDLTYDGVGIGLGLALAGQMR